MYENPTIKCGMSKIKIRIQHIISTTESQHMYKTKLCVGKNVLEEIRPKY